jgi:hypothetical protein
MVFEIVQSAAILFIGVFVIGLTRQLGLFMMPRPAQLAEQGPRDGAALPLQLVDSEAQVRLKEAIRQSGSHHALVAIVDHVCPACHALLDQMRVANATGVGGVPPSAIIVKGSDDDFVQTVFETGAAVLVDPRGEAAASVGIRATPFVLLLDRELRVIAKDVGGDLMSFLERVLGPSAKPITHLVESRGTAAR